MRPPLPNGVDLDAVLTRPNTLLDGIGGKISASFPGSCMFSYDL